MASAISMLPGKKMIVNGSKARGQADTKTGKGGEGFFSPPYLRQRKSVSYAENAL